MDNRLRILFASPHCLLDKTNGAALATWELMIQLTQRGFPCEAVTASICDPSREVSMEEVLSRHSLAKIKRTDFIKGLPLIEVNDGIINHTILRTHSSRRSALTGQEGEAFLSLVEEKISQSQPQLLLTYGGLSAERKIHLLAHKHDTSVVFYLHNSLYTKTETFSEVDLILVPSEFLSKFYQEKLSIQSQVLYPLFKNEDYLVTHRDPRYITFINPIPDKGLTLFARIISEALRELPQAQFLVVEGRWNQANVARVGLKLDRIPNVQVIPYQQDMKTVYAQTKMILYPSFMGEAFGRIVVEAQLNGIPVLASRQGGIPEALNGGGFLFDLPERCMKKWMAIPTAEEVNSWIETLRTLLEDPKAYEEAQRRAFQAAEKFNPERNIQEAMNLLHGVRA